MPDHPGKQTLEKFAEAVATAKWGGSYIITFEEIRSISDAYKALEAENDRLRKIVSECATALGNGAYVGPECTIEFMGELPREIALHVAALRPAILEEAAQVAYRHGQNIDWDDGDGGQFGHGFEAACEEVSEAIRALAHTTGQECER